MKIKPISFAILSILLGGAVNAEPLTALMVPTSFKALASCPETTIDPSSPTMVTTVVRVLIEKDLNVTDGERRVRYTSIHPAKDDESEYDDSDVDNPARSSSDYNDFVNDPFHIYLKGIDPSTSRAKYIQIKVFLHSNRYDFYNDTAHGVGVAFDGSYGTIPWLCQNADGLGTYTKHANHPVLIFYVIKGMAADTKQINIMLKSHTTAGAQTPIIIDPKIKNDGT